MMHHVHPRRWRARLLATGTSLLLIAAAACNSGTSDKPRSTPSSTPMVDPTPTEDLEAARVAALEKAASEAGALLADAYTKARAAVAPVRGTARYWGDYTYGVRVGAALLETEIGFGGFEYLLECDIAAPPPICAVARAFSPGNLVAAAKELALLGAEEIQVVIEGRADGNWKPRAKPEIYQGQCGEAECTTGGEPLRVANGLAINSNEALACLRALCVLSESGLANVGLSTEIRGTVAAKGAKAESRRAELAFEGKLTGDGHRLFWRAFRTAVGH